MRAFSELLDQLYFTNSKKAKSNHLRHYLQNTPSPERGWAIAAIAGQLKFPHFKRALIKNVVTQRVDPVLFDLSYDYVGETSETVAHIWPATENTAAIPPTLSEVVQHFQQADRQSTEKKLIEYLDCMTPSQRWALIKLGTGGLRIGISSRQLKLILAEYGDKPVEQIEALWHGLTPPYTDLLLWLENRADKPDISGKATFHPVMLANPVDEQALPIFSPEDWLAEWKYDGIRAQLNMGAQETRLYSRSGDDISGSFPDLISALEPSAVIDGELLVKQDDTIASFNHLQQRLNKKKPSKKLMKELPAIMVVYDILSRNGESLTHLTMLERRKQLEALLHQLPADRFRLSQALTFKNNDDLHRLRRLATDQNHTDTEGVMLKRKDSQYKTGRPAGMWYKWKKAPETIDAILMYAQRGHGKRSSYYSDFTFGLFEGDTLLPVGKAYSGFTDEELNRLDKWVRNNTIAKYGPVREVAKTMVVEVAFDAVHESPRHKSGLALRFPRFKAIRWDKPVEEADPLAALQKRLPQPT